MENKNIGVLFTLAIIIIGLPILLTWFVSSADNKNQKPTQAIRVQLNQATISKVPESLLQSLDEVLKTGLEIGPERPSIIPTIIAQENVFINIDNALAVQVYGQNVSLLSDYLETEINHRTAKANPQESQFTLPDGTTGTEITPGDPQNAWKAYQDLSSCKVTLLSDTNLWLCKGTNKVLIFASDELSGSSEILSQWSKEPASESYVAINKEEVESKLGYPAENTDCEDFLCDIIAIYIDFAQEPVATYTW